MGRMNLFVVLELFLLAVMVTAKRDNDRIASKRIIQADVAAAKLKRHLGGNKAIVQASNVSNATKRMQADPPTKDEAGRIWETLGEEYSNLKKGDECYAVPLPCEYYPNEHCEPKAAWDEYRKERFRLKCGRAYGCSTKGYCWSSCIYGGPPRNGAEVGWRWMNVDNQDPDQQEWLRCSPDKGAAACVNTAKAIGKIDMDKNRCYFFGETSSQPGEKTKGVTYEERFKGFMKRKE